MIAPGAFRMVELLSREDLREHPLWADFHDARDRERILGWGVATERLDAEIARYDYCGRSPLFPVLDLASAAEVANPTVALRIATRSGLALEGYRMGHSAIGVFAGDLEVCLNPSLPSRARAELARLADALGIPPADVAPLRHARVRALDGVDLAALERAHGPLEGEVAIDPERGGS